MTEISKSPDRMTFQKEGYVKRCELQGKLPNPEYLAMYAKWIEERNQRESNTDWQHNNMEYDLRSTEWILNKVRDSDVYAQNLYAAMCNREFQQLDVWPILAGETWHCSWRYAGGIIADMRGAGDYIDWYCSGIQSSVTDEQYMSMTDQEKEAYEQMRGYVSEGTVTEQIETDLQQLGWAVLPSTDET
jgi:hypothetical protein